jgi:hypothetical protein
MQRVTHQRYTGRLVPGNSEWHGQTNLIETTKLIK